MADVVDGVEVPRGVKLVAEFGGVPEGQYYGRVKFSPDGSKLAACWDGGVEVWAFCPDPKRLWQNDGWGDDLAWSDNGERLAVTTTDGLHCYSKDGTLFRAVPFGDVTATCWASNERLVVGTREGVVTAIDVVDSSDRTTRLASGLDTVLGLTAIGAESLLSASWDGSVREWKLGKRKEIRRWTITPRLAHRATLLPKQNVILAATSSGLRAWDRLTGRAIVEATSGPLMELAVSNDERLVVGADWDGGVAFFDTVSWRQLASFRTGRREIQPGLATHPSRHWLSSTGRAGKVLRIWEYDPDILLGRPPPKSALRYTNAKVVLLGDSGVGKTGLGRVLTGQKWEPTDSTHARTVWSFDKTEAPNAKGERTLRETMLWDLAGQPGYRLVHQLHLHDVALAVLVCDASSETDPLAGVRYWDKALK